MTIYWCSNANGILRKPLRVDLLAPGRMKDLIVEYQQPLHVAKLDTGNYFYMLSIPQLMSTYFALPSSRMNGEEIWPVRRNIPMNWSHADYTNQEFHESIRHGVRFPKERIWLEQKGYNKDEDFDFRLINDHFIFRIKQTNLFDS